MASDDLHLLIQGVVQRKKRFYTMKTHHIRMQARDKEIGIKERTNEAKGQAYIKIRAVQRQLRTVSVSVPCSTTPTPTHTHTHTHTHTDGLVQY